MQDEKTQERNDMIAVFCGGVLENNPLLGQQYRFDKDGTPKHLMKCPPFGTLGRTSLQFDIDYNWLMFAIKHCKEKATTPELIAMYNDIKESLTDFDLHNAIDYTYMGVCTFIAMYNEKI